MAMSLSHPDPASPAAVADASFGTTRRGFAQGEVRDFLRMVAAELGRLQERERFLEGELRHAQTNPDLSAVDLDDAALTRLLGEEMARVLSTAREAANEIREKAERSGAQMLMEASDEAARVREEADIEAARRRADAAADAESELEMAKQQGREMVNEARAYRERVLSELARRRELAREQIEQLIHGRDRLAQAFERARLVAVDVVAELEPLGEPNEYVNLSPTTGPVPVMVANEPRSPVAGDRHAGGDHARDAGSPTSAAGSEPAADDGDELDEAVADEAVADEAAYPDATGTDDEQEAGDADAATVADPAADAPDAASGDVAEAATDGVAEEFTGDVAEEATDDVAEEATDDAAEEVEAQADDTAADDGPDESGVGDADESGLDDAEAGFATDDADDDQDVDGGDGTAPDRRDRDEVVVDLFARLRADRARSGDESSDADVVTDDGSESTEAAATGSATLVGDLERSSAAPVDGSDGEPDGAGDEDTPFRQRDAELTPIIVSSARKLKRALADEQNEVLDRLRRGEAVSELDGLLPDVGDHLTRYRDAMTDELLLAANAGARAATGGRVKRLRKKPGEIATGAAADVLEEWVIVPLRERLERCVAEGEGDNATVSRRVRSVYREWKTQHIDEQLDDVVRMAYGAGAFEATEPGTLLVWSVDGEHPACPDCDDNGLAGPVAAGDEFPTGHLFAPAHPGCRCLLLPPDR